MLFAQVPKTDYEWCDIASEFDRNWNFKNCLGALDGKHVMQAPPNTGSQFYNYKGTFSIVLLALVDARYRFTYVDIGCQGRISDGGVFAHSTLYKILTEENTLNIPAPIVLPGRMRPMPYVVVADDAFPLKPNILKPYCGVQPKGSRQRIFNYRLSRARRIVENSFGILGAVFRVLRAPIALQNVENVIKVVKACCVLHNFRRRDAESRHAYGSPGTFDYEDTTNGVLTPGSWRNETDAAANNTPGLRPLAKQGSNIYIVKMPKTSEMNLLTISLQRKAVCHGSGMLHNASCLCSSCPHAFYSRRVLLCIIDAKYTSFNVIYFIPIYLLRRTVNVHIHSDSSYGGRVSIGDRPS